MTAYEKLEVLVNKYDSVQLGQDDNKPELCDVFTPNRYLPATITDFIAAHFNIRFMSRNQIKFIVKEKN